MESPATPQRRSTRAATQLTPDQTRRIEENRLKAKALREKALARDAAEAISKATSLKRPHEAIEAPSTIRDARHAPADTHIQPARKFRHFVDHDFSISTDTKGGFLSTEDDPFSKQMRAPASATSKPEHMTLKEWERHQLLKSLRDRKAGPFEPSLGLNDTGKKCKECGTKEIDWQWDDVFGCQVCARCKDKVPEKYSLLTKTEAKDDYLLTDEELKDPELLPHLNKPNPHKSHWHDMMLFLRYQVEEYAINVKWKSAEALDAEFERREAEKKKRKEDKFNSKLKELKKKTRTEAYMRNLKNKGKGKGQFGDDVGNGRHEHDWGQTVENEEGMSVKTCLECGMEVEELSF